MAENEFIDYLKYEIKKCYEEHEGCCAMVKNGTCTCREAISLSVLEKYQAIGTVEECQEAREKQRKKRYEIINMIRHCSECDCELKIWYTFCPDCGQAIDWSDT